MNNDDDDMHQFAEDALRAMQEAIDEELERKAKLGYNAVVADKNGDPIVVPAKYLVRLRRRQQKRKAQKCRAEACPRPGVG